MFEIDRARTSLPLPPDRVLALVASLNEPLVVADDMPVEPTRAYICAYTEGGDRCAFSIYLHCMDSNKGVFYRYEEKSLPRARFDEAMAEAMAFAESLGFMMDDLGWRDLDAARRRELLDETPLFHEPRPRPAPAEVEVAQAEAPSPPSPVASPPPSHGPAAAAPPPPLPAAAHAPAPAPAAPGDSGPVLTIGATDVELEIEPPAAGPARPPAPLAGAPAAHAARAAHGAGAAPRTPSRSAPAAPPVTVDTLPSRVTGPAAPGPTAPSAPALAAAAQVIVRLLASL